MKERERKCRKEEGEKERKRGGTKKTFADVTRVNCQRCDGGHDLAKLGKNMVPYFISPPLNATRVPALQTSKTTAREDDTARARAILPR